MSAGRDDRLVWIDIETSGLDPKTDLLLEIACIVTDDDLEEIDGGKWVLGTDADTVAAVRQGVAPVVDQMHTASGLWQEVSGPWALSADYVSDRLRDLLDDTLADGSRLAGSSVHFDRAWLKVHFPEVESRLHYRNLDVTSVAYAAAQWTGCGQFPKAKAHRATADIRESIAEYRWLRQQMVPVAKLTSPETARAAAKARMAEPTDWWVMTAGDILQAGAAHVTGQQP